jgi:hypothetical protein
MKKVFSTCLIFVMFVSMAFAQKSKPWTEWSKKDAEKMLNDSGWGQTQDDTDASELTYSPTANTTITQTTSSRNADRNLNDASRTESGAKNQALSLKYRVRFFSAKPIRQAFARMILLSQKTTDEQALKQFKERLQAGFIDIDYGDFVVVAVTIEATDRRLSGPAEQAFRSATSDTLKNKCYLERKDGKRVFLIQYEQPTPDQTGAKFVFPRTVDGKPLLTVESEGIRFVAEFSDKVKVERKFKVSEMIYDGKLEY